jgi:hypothetical protein
MSPRRSLLGIPALALVLAAPVSSRAEPPAAILAAAAVPAGASSAVSDALLSGLAEHAARFEDMKRRGAFTLSGHLEELDGDGKPSAIKDILFRSTPTSTPMDRITNVVRYTENGEDKTADAQKRAIEGRAKKLKSLLEPAKVEELRKKDLRLPFLAAEQARYVFSVAERDAAGGRVRIAFVPKVPAENALKGSAWVEEKDREVLTIGFSLSKNPTFVDHVDVTIAFGMVTPLGRAPSRISFDGRGSFLFIRKHLRGSATLSEPRLAL